MNNYQCSENNGYQTVMIYDNLDERGRRHASFLKDYAPIPGQSVHGGVRFHFL